MLLVLCAGRFARLLGARVEQLLRRLVARLALENRGLVVVLSTRNHGSLRARLDNSLVCVLQVVHNETRVPEVLACMRTYELRALYSVRAVPLLCVEGASVSGDAVE